MDLPVAILPDPERAFCPCQPRVGAAAGCRDRGQDMASLRIDLLNAILGQLKQIPAIEGRSCMRGDINRTQHLSARRIERIQRVSGSKPDVAPVIRDAVYVIDTGKRAVLTNDLSG